jgi:hypothetical protein
MQAMKTKERKESKVMLSKYLLGAAVVGALALSPAAVKADDHMEAYGAAAVRATPVPEPIAVTGTVDNYWLDRSGYVSAMSLNTGGDKKEIIRFSPSQARRLYTKYPVGSDITVWVTPGHGKRKYWNARALGADRPVIWYPVNTTSDFDWLSARAYVLPDTKHSVVTGKLRGIVTDKSNDVLALAIETPTGHTLVRVPPELRQVSRGHIGSERVAPLFKGSNVEVRGIVEAPRWGVLTPFSSRIAADTIAINGKHAGSIGIQSLPRDSRESLLNWNIGGLNNDSIFDSQAAELGYGIYRPEGEPMGENMAAALRPSNNATVAIGSTRATGRVVLRKPSGEELPVVEKNGRYFAQASGGRSYEIRHHDGRFAVPVPLEGSRMQMIMADNTKYEMDTVDGRLMVVLADGTKSAVTLHTL